MMGQDFLLWKLCHMMFYLTYNHTWASTWLRGGVILKGLMGFRGGTQRVGLSKGGNPKIWPILGGESSDSGGRIGLKFSKGGTILPKSTLLEGGKSQSKIFLGGISFGLLYACPRMKTVDSKNFDHGEKS